MNLIDAQQQAAGVPWLSIITWLPMLGAFILMGVPKEHDKIHKGLALAWSGLVFLISLAIVPAFNGELAGFQLVESKAWIEALGIRYALGIDGISYWLVILTTFLTPLIILGTWGSVEKKVREFMICFLISLGETSSSSAPSSQLVQVVRVALSVLKGP